MGNQLLVWTGASDAILCWHHGCFNGAWDGSVRCPALLVLTALGLLALLCFVAADFRFISEEWRPGIVWRIARSTIAPPALPPAKGFDSNQIAMQFPPDDDILIEVETRQKLRPSDPTADA